MSTKKRIKIKISENVVKVTNPSFKKVYRFYDKSTNKALADVIALHDETIPEDNYAIFDPVSPWKKKTLKNYTLINHLQLAYDENLQVKILFLIHDDS